MVTEGTKIIRNVANDKVATLQHVRGEDPDLFITLDQKSKTDNSNQKWTFKKNGKEWECSCQHDGKVLYASVYQPGLGESLEGLTRPTQWSITRDADKVKIFIKVNGEELYWQKNRSGDLVILQDKEHDHEKGGQLWTLENV